MFNRRKPIKEFGKIYDYLKDHKLRAEEKQNTHIQVKDADFRGEEFINVKWDHFHFFNCRFPTAYRLQVSETTNCIFSRCEFGPGAKDATLLFGGMRNVRFDQCKQINGNVSTRGEGSFNNCEFENTVPRTSTSWNHFLSGDSLVLSRCTFRNVDLSVEVKLHMKHCDYASAGSGQLNPGTNYTADIILEETLLKNAEELLWNAKLKNLTLKECRVLGLFSAQESWIEDTILLEGLRVGTYEFARCGPEKKFIIRDCRFSEIDERTGYLFLCSGDFAAETLLERVECTAAAPCNLTGASPKTTEDFRIAKTQSNSFTLRNCKIPTLWLNWLQTHHLVIENCEFGTLELKNARIGKVTIKNSKFDTLDLTRTLAGKFEIDSASTGHIVKTESNYPEGGYKIDGGKQDG